MLVSVGDSTICALNKNGIIQESVNTPIPTHVAALTVAFNQDSTVKLRRVPKMHFTILNKKDVDGLILASDGVIENNIQRYLGPIVNWDTSSLGFGSITKSIPMHDGIIYNPLRKFLKALTVSVSAEFLIREFINLSSACFCCCLFNPIFSS